MFRIENSFHNQAVISSQVSQASPAQKGICSKISDIFSRAAAWICDLILRLCCCQKTQLPSAPQPLALPHNPAPVPEAQPLPVDPPPVLTGYHIIDNPNPEPYVFEPRHFPHENRYPLIRARFEGQIGHYQRLANATQEQLDRLEELYRREPDAALREEIAGLEQEILSPDAESWAASQGLQHDVRGMSQRPLHIVPIDEAELEQIDINDLLVYFEEIHQQAALPEMQREVENYRIDVSRRIRRFMDFVNEPGNEELQRTTRIFIQTLRRPHTYDESFIKRVFFLIFSDARSNRVYFANMKCATKFLIDINGPILPGWGPNESLLYHLITAHNYRAQESDYRRMIEDGFSPDSHIRILQSFFIRDLARERLISISDMLSQTTFSELEAFQELCNRLMGEDAAASFLEATLHDYFLDDGLTGVGSAFFLEHMGFLTRENQPQPVHQAPPVVVDRDRYMGLARHDEASRQQLTDELASRRRRILPLQACLQNPRWIGVRHIFESAIDTNRQKIQIIEENLAAPRN